LRKFESGSIDCSQLEPEDDDPDAFQLESLDPSPWEWPQAPAGIEAQPAWQAPELKLDDTALPASAVQSCEAKLQIVSEAKDNRILVLDGDDAPRTRAG